MALPLRRVFAQGVLPFRSVSLNPLAHSLDVVAFLLSERSRRTILLLQLSGAGESKP